jgi:hypothetical protein
MGEFSLTIKDIAADITKRLSSKRQVDVMLVQDVLSHLSDIYYLQSDIGRLLYISGNRRNNLFKRTALKIKREAKNANVV